jgi:hypothetical protein
MIQRPVAVGLVVCEQVIVEEGTRNITLVNCFSQLQSEEFPSPSHRLAVFATLTDGVGNGTVSLVIARLDTLEEVMTLDHPVHFADPLQEAWVIFFLDQFSFPVPGRYQFGLSLDGEPVTHRVIEVQAREDQP